MTTAEGDLFGRWRRARPRGMPGPFHAGGMRVNGSHSLRLNPAPTGPRTSVRSRGIMCLADKPLEGASLVMLSTNPMSAATQSRFVTTTNEMPDSSTAKPLNTTDAAPMNTVYRYARVQTSPSRGVRSPSAARSTTAFISQHGQRPDLPRHNTTNSVITAKRHEGRTANPSACICAGDSCRHQRSTAMLSTRPRRRWPLGRVARARRAASRCCSGCPRMALHPAMSNHPESTSVPRGDGDGRNSASRLLSSCQTPTCRRGKTGGRSTHDRIIRHLGYPRQTTGLRRFARRISRAGQ